MRRKIASETAVKQICCVDQRQTKDTTQRHKPRGQSQLSRRGGKIRLGQRINTIIITTNTRPETLAFCLHTERSKPISLTHFSLLQVFFFQSKRKNVKATRSLPTYMVKNKTHPCDLVILICWVSGPRPLPQRSAGVYSTRRKCSEVQCSGEP